MHTGDTAVHTTQVRSIKVPIDGSILSPWDTPGVDERHGMHEDSVAGQITPLAKRQGQYSSLRILHAWRVLRNYP